ncbi:MAG: hypothetical protein JWN25_1580 [Verrucomicrobiales bacterium]|nr:hypothetical protein [Verrucomicrobiales bacterium]
MRKFVILFLTLAGLIPAALADSKLQITDGDRIVLIGDTLIEREQEFGYLETHLHIQFPTNKFIVRNLGWSADTPAGLSRLRFDFKQPSKGLEIIRDELAAIKPTIVFVGYGMASSFDAAEKTNQFVGELKSLVKVIRETGSNDVKLVFLGPIHHEDWARPEEAQKIEKHNKDIQLYSDAIKDVASENNGIYIPLFKTIGASLIRDQKFAMTGNGIHLNQYGYAEMANIIDRELGWGILSWRISFLEDGSQRRGGGGISVTNSSKTGVEVSFDGLPAIITLPHPNLKREMLPSYVQAPFIQAFGMTNQLYNLIIDDVQYDTITVTNGRMDLPLLTGPDIEQAEKLRKAVVEKNQLFFYRWRPQNETYLFGFRKQEQGKNGKEIPMFDLLISQLEDQIQSLTIPQKHHFLVTPKWAPPAAVTRGQPKINPLPPSERPTFEVADGFQVNLYAENPLLAKPIQMNFDSRGRLWVSSSSVYPQIEPGQKANDKIIIIEDTNGNGVANKSTVFADGLLIPSAVIPGDGGVYVGQSTELLFLKDLDGDGKADLKKVVLSGLGTEDTHHIVHTLRWGMDGDLYFNQSIYIHSHIETPNGVVRANSGAIFKYETDRDRLTILLKGFCNPWGTSFDPYGQIFVTDGAGFQGISYGIPGATYFTYADMRREMKSVSPGNYPKFAGLEMIQSEQFPPDWQGNLITCDFRAHRVVRFGLSEEGAGYVTRELPDLLRTTNVTFRPIDVKLGPDGALYVADWSNPIIQHGEVDFRDPRRDHEHGRIWRITAKNRPLVNVEGIKSGNALNMFAGLLSSNSWTRDVARRTLIERGTNVLARRDKWVATLTNDWQKLQALWLKQGSREIDTNLLAAVLASEDGKIRAAGIRVLGDWLPSLPTQDTVDKLLTFVKDSHPRARLEAIRVLGQIQTEKAAEAVLSALDQPMDPFLDYAMWLSINELAEPWLQSLQSGHWKPEGRGKQLEFALKSIEPAMAEKVLSGLVAKMTPEQLISGSWIELIGLAGSTADLERLSALLLKREVKSPALESRILNAFVEASRLRNIKLSGSPLDLLNHSKTADIEGQLTAIRLMGTYKAKESVPILEQMAQSGDVAIQKGIVDSLRSIASPAAGDSLVKLGSSITVEIRQTALLALASFDLGKASQPLADLLKAVTDENQALPVWKTLFSIRGGSARLVPVISKNGVSAASARAGLRAARESNKSQDPLALLLAKFIGAQDDPKALSDDEMKKLAATAVAQGSADSGESIFRRASTGCLACHAIGGAGGKVGPDLTSIGASAQPDYLVESLFYPNRKIKEGFNSVVVQTTDDQELNGILVKESAEELVIRDPANRELSIPKKIISGRRNGGSLMPSGLMEALSPGEQLDLVKFLSELGKGGPYDASRSSVARTWTIYGGAHTDEQFGLEKIVSGQFPAGKETVTYTSVPGWLTESQLKEVFPANLNTSLTGIYAAARFSVSRNGENAFDFNGSGSTGIWVDGKEVIDLKHVSLTAGEHTLVIRFNAKSLPARFRVASEGATFINK